MPARAKASTRCRRASRSFGKSFLIKRFSRGSPGTILLLPCQWRIKRLPFRRSLGTTKTASNRMKRLYLLRNTRLKLVPFSPPFWPLFWPPPTLASAILLREVGKRGIEGTRYLAEPVERVAAPVFFKVGERTW